MNYEGKLRSTAGITDGFSRWESRVGGVGNGNIKKSNCNLQPSGVGRYMPIAFSRWRGQEWGLNLKQLFLPQKVSKCLIPRWTWWQKIHPSIYSLRWNYVAFICTPQSDNPPENHRTIKIIIKGHPRRGWVGFPGSGHQIWISYAARLDWRRLIKWPEKGKSGKWDFPLR